MSSTAKVVWVIVILAIIAGAYYWYTQSQGGTMAPMQMATTSPMTGTSSASNSDTSNAALVQDTAAIDSQMSGLNSDNTNMNSSDQPVSQSY